MLVSFSRSSVSTIDLRAVARASGEAPLPFQDAEGSEHDVWVNAKVGGDLLRGRIDQNSESVSVLPGPADQFFRLEARLRSGSAGGSDASALRPGTPTLLRPFDFLNQLPAPLVCGEVGAGRINDEWVDLEDDGRRLEVRLVQQGEAAVVLGHPLDQVR
jgi:hypothetical protein